VRGLVWELRVGIGKGSVFMDFLLGTGIAVTITKVGCWGVPTEQN
jgi:hypothetical protein